MRRVLWLVLWSQFPLCCALGFWIGYRVHVRRAIRRRVGQIAAGQFPA